MKNKTNSKNGFFTFRVLIGVLLCFSAITLVLFALGGASAQPQTAPPSANKIAPEVLAETADGKSASVVIFLADQANITAAHAMRDQDARGWYVYNTLTQHVAVTQVGLKNFLSSKGVAYQSFWAANMLVATADRALVEALATRADVARVDSNRPTRWIEDPSISNFGVTPSDPAVVEWGVQNVNAPQVWALGFTGQGIVIGNEDTGVRWTHIALKPHYRGWNGTTADHNYNWHDSIHSGGGVCGPNNQAPCDDSGHGTHTTGSTSGDDGAGNQVGVAPGAKWIGCRNMDQGNGTPATYTECFQFFIAPTDLNGQNPNPALRPHVINNSWICPTSEGCTTGDELRVIVENTQAAGIFVEASAGNGGPGCSSVNDPPAIYEAAFSTGAIDISNTIAGFSSRGPVIRDGSNRLKPNLSAPGVNVRSSYNTSDTTYANLSGTSMAGPHTVGVVALLWSARPQLVRDIATTKTVLQNTANPMVIVNPVQTCGGIPSTTIPNNSFGYGRVDALAAVNSVPQGSPTPTATASPTPTPTPTSSPTPTPCVGQYVINQIGGSIVPGTTDIGNHADDLVTTIPLPFSYTLYGTTYTSVNLSSNGNAQFTTTDSAFTNVCLPWLTHDYSIFPYWDDQRTDAQTGCSGFPGGTCGIYTSVSGTSPNRIFNIEWRTVYFASPTQSANHELRLYEGQSRFDVIYGAVALGNTSATAGAQKNDTAFTQYFCNGTGGAATGGQSYTLQPCGTPSPTPTATATATAIATSTPTSTPTGTPAQCSWGAGPNMPSVGVRHVGVYFPANGRFYAMGGRSSDVAGSDFTHPFEYNPATNSWTTKAATYSDNQVNNMACGVLTLSGTPYIYCVGGSAAGATTATARVFFYNPVTDVITALTAADNWPGDSAGTILPGGFSVYNNKLYILGGFNINVASTNQIWQFDPTAAVGSKWLQRVNTPMGIMYAPTCTIGNFIYVAGASDYSGGTVIDTTNSFSFNPVTNTIGAIPPIPRATGETRAVNFCGRMYVLGGGRVAPNPSNEVDVFDGNGWSLGLPFFTARRNFPADTDGTNRIWLAGGYAPTTPTDSMEIFNCPVSPCGGASPTPTATATATAVATATPTSTRTPTPTPTATATATSTPPATPTPTARPTVTPRPRPTPRPR